MTGKKLQCELRALRSKMVGRDRQLRAWKKERAWRSGAQRVAGCRERERVAKRAQHRYQEHRGGRESKKSHVSPVLPVRSLSYSTQLERQ